MFGHTFYHETIRKYIILFGTLFNDIYIQRNDNSGNNIQNVKIPISYAPRDKILSRLDTDPGLNRQVAVNLPRMSFDMSAMTYDPERKLNTIQKNVALITRSDGGENAQERSNLKSVYNPVPYTMNFSLYVYVKNAEDGTKILEQILPFFTPDWTATVNLLPEMELTQDIPTILNSVSTEDIYEGDFITRRALIHTLEFTMKGYVFGPVSKSGVITLANTNFFIDDRSATPGSSNTIVETLDTRAGLLANGSPTSNATLTIGRDEIDANDNFGYINTLTPVDDQDTS
jgi:hypothetical protein